MFKYNKRAIGIYKPLQGNTEAIVILASQNKTIPKEQLQNQLSKKHKGTPFSSLCVTIQTKEQYKASKNITQALQRESKGRILDTLNPHTQTPTNRVFH